MEEEYRNEGRYITATDAAESLSPHLNISQVLLWSPDLFAYTSDILAKTYAYQLVVSPPSKKKWQPDKAEIEEWLCRNAAENIRHWYESIKHEWRIVEDFDFHVHFKEIEKWKEGDWKEIWKKFWKERIRKDEKSGINLFHEVSDWEALVRVAGMQWREKLKSTNQRDFDLIDDNHPLANK